MAEGDYLPSIIAVRIVRDRIVHLTFDDGLADMAPEPLYDEVKAANAAHSTTHH
jgi:hypothetical protein